MWDGKVPTRMDLFTYLVFLNEMNELFADEKTVYSGIGKDFLSIMETTDMQKVYKMPILYSFYNDGNVRLEVTEEEALKSRKKFFDNGTNWKDFAPGITYLDYRKMTDRQHLSKAKIMPIRFLISSGKGFFVEKEGYALAIRQDLEGVIGNAAFRNQMKDIPGYRTVEYYRPILF